MLTLAWMSQTVGFMVSGNIVYTMCIVSSTCVHTAGTVTHPSCYFIGSFSLCCPTYIRTYILDKDVFILDKYRMHGSLPKVTAEVRLSCLAMYLTMSCVYTYVTPLQCCITSLQVLLKIAALCQEQRPKLS